MIHLFKGTKRVLFFPKAWANSVSSWLLGVRSSDGSIIVKNTANPGTDGSLDLRVNPSVITRKIRELANNRGLTDNEIARVKEVVHGLVDGVSIKWQDSVFSVDTDWLADLLIKNGIGGSGKTEDLTHDDITDWGTATEGFLTEDDYDTLSGAIDDILDLLDGIAEDLADCLYTGDIGVTVAAQNHSHSDYALTGHTHDGYALTGHTHTEYSPVGHTHSQYSPTTHTHSNYANSTHTHAKADLTNFDANVKALIPGCYQVGPTLYNTVPNNYVMFYIPGSGGNSGTICYADLDDEYAPKEHTHTGYAAADHTHTGYAASNHTHSGYAAANHSHSEYAQTSAVEQLLQIVNGIVADYAKSGDIQNAISTFSNTASSTYATKAQLQQLVDELSELDLDNYLTKTNIPQEFITAIAARKSGPIKVCTGVTWNGTKLAYTYREVTVTQGLITNIPAQDSSTDINTPTVISWS